MARESSFWKWLRGVMPRGLFTRIESEVSPGVPDVYFSISNHSGWIELKSLAAPKTDRAKPLKRRGLNPDQVIWIDNHRRNGVRVYIFIKLGSFVYIFGGHHATRLNDYTYGEIRAFAEYTLKLRTDKCNLQSSLKKILTQNPLVLPYLSRLKDSTPEQTKMVRVKPTSG